MNLFEKILISKGDAPGLMSQKQDHHNPVKTITPGMPELLRRAAAQGAVLLENQCLPFAEGMKLSLFGRVQIDHFCTGYGSGGDVNYPYSVGLLEGLRHCPSLRLNEDLAAVYEAWVKENPADHGIWGSWPRHHKEMPVSEALVTAAREASDNAVIILGRAAGEDRESALEEGSYYLTQEERALLKAVTAQFPQAVLVLNIGAVMDFSFLKEYSFGAVLLAWQGGMESGNAIADLLCGAQTPSGHLSDTIACNYKFYPSSSHFGGKDSNLYFEDIYVGYRYFETFGQDKVLYPFGYGLTYTQFERKAEQVSPLSFRVTVTNAGSLPGRDTAMLFVGKPNTRLQNPARELVAFAKTRELQPGESESLNLTVTRYQLSAFDDSGVTGHKDCYVLQSGVYRFYCGDNVRDAALAGAYTLEETTVFKTLTEAAAPQEDLMVLGQVGGKPGRRKAPKATRNLKDRITSQLPKSLPLTGDQGFKLKQVQSGEIDLDTFLAQLDTTDLEAISRGGYVMDHPLGARGNAGIFGGVTESLRAKGIPAITCTDGPSGLRLYDSASLLPIGTLLACSFDVGLIQELYTAVAGEMKTLGSDVLLAPGMNIHRNPLCGRNFEYYSEDPYLTGRIAAAVVKGVQSQGLSACPKHFACNSQEYNRYQNNSILSQRALREIYLKGFEVCVKLARPKVLMTSYNKINGVWGHYHFDLIHTILRGEWGYEGLVVTDWWMQYAPSPEFPKLTGNAYRVRSRVDVLMPGNRTFSDRRTKPDGTLLKSFGKPDGIALGEMQAAARHVLETVLKLKRL